MVTEKRLDRASSTRGRLNGTVLIEGERLNQMKVAQRRKGQP